MRTDALLNRRPLRSPPRWRAVALMVSVILVLSVVGPAAGQERPAAAPAPAARATGTAADGANFSAANAGGRTPTATPPAGAPPLAVPPTASFLSPAAGSPTSVTTTADGTTGTGATGGGPALSPAPAAPTAIPGLPQVPDLSKRENVSAALQLVVLLTVLSLAPAILLMMTSFTRIVIVLSLLRQAMGTQSLPPNQVMIGLSMFMTFLVMAPTFSAVNENALKPYMEGKDKTGQPFDQTRALAEAERPVRKFMIDQIERSGNEADVDLFARHAGQKEPAKTWEEIKTSTLIPAFVLSELKTAFLMGFKIYLPFLIIDMVISTVLISMGMMMLPPAMISLPFKLLLFVLVDGWHLIVENLMGSFR
jgi:flagellar biosynthetic protein FliP